MQVIEDMEEGILCFELSCKELDIVEQEHVNTLIEIDEVVDFLLDNSGRVLALKNPGRHIKHPHARILLLELDADSLQKVGLAHTRRAKDEQGIVGLDFRVLSNGLSNAHSELVAHAAAIVVKGVSRIELRIDVLQPIVIVKRIGYTRSADLEFLPEPRAHAGLMLLHSTGVVTAHYIIFIGKLDILAKHLFQGSRKDGDISSLDLLYKELRGHSERNAIVILIIVNGNNGSKPNIELFGRQVCLNDVKAAVPLLCNVIHLTQIFA